MISTWGGMKSLAAFVRGIFDKYGAGTNAHMYQAGEMVPVLGAEFVPTPLDFTSGWNVAGAGAAASANSISASGIGGMTRNLGLVIGTTYKATITCTASVAAALYNAAGNANLITDLAVGTNTYSVVFSALSASVYIRLTGAGSVSDVSLSIKQVTSYTSTLNGFTSGNYGNSSGSTVATIDQPVGLVLDAAGSVGSEIGLNKPKSAGNLRTGYTYDQSTSTVTCSGSNSAYSTMTDGTGDIQIPNTAGKSYQVRYEITGTGQIGFGVGDFPNSIVGFKSAGVYEYVWKGSTSNFAAVQTGSGFTGTLRIISVVEITGLHLSNATTAQQPKLRRGIVNLLTASDSTASATFYNPGVGAYTDNGLVTVATPYGATQARKITVTTTARVRWGDTTSGLINTAYTGGLWVATADGQTRSADLYTNAGGTTQAITITPVFQLFAQAGSNNGVNLHRFADLNNLPVGEYYIGRLGMFQGTLTAAQILAYGGIPLTSTQAASSNLGPRWFDMSSGKSLIAPAQAGFDNVTVVRSSPADGVVTLTGQNLSAGYTINTDFSSFIAVKGDLTSAELLNLQKQAQKAAGL